MPLLTEVAADPLSTQLRVRTAPLHGQIEALLGLPGAIFDRDDYGRWLVRFLGLYDPLELSLAEFNDWEAAGLPRPGDRHSADLRHDLAALGDGPDAFGRTARAPAPRLASFAHALGAAYVLEGAALGGKLILRDLNARIGTSIAGATDFFAGGSAASTGAWPSFRAALDRFGAEQPLRRDDVVAGAALTFTAMLAWFAPFRAGSTPAANAG